MKSSKMTIQIILIVLSGTFTMGLSVFALIEGDQKEKENKQTQRKLQDAQQQLIQKQEENNQKSDRIIELQNKLKELADSSQRELNKLKYPVPQKAQISMSMQLQLPHASLDRIRESFQLAPGQSNLITQQMAADWELGSQVQQLFGASFRAFISFKADQGKSLKFVPAQQPMRLLSAVTSSKNSFTLYYHQEQDKLILDGWLLETDIQSSDSVSMFDYKDAEVEVAIQFGHPIFFQGAIAYAQGIEPVLPVKLDKLTFGSKHYTFQLEDFQQQQQPNTFISKVALNLI